LRSITTRKWCAKISTGLDLRADDGPARLLLARIAQLESRPGVEAYGIWGDSPVLAQG
jgi:hypothetical protein